MGIAIGVDVGGTNIVCGAIDEAGNVLARRKRLTEAGQGAGAVLDRIADMVQEVIAELGGMPVAGIGVGVPGLIDPNAGVSRSAANLNWQDVPVVTELERRCGLPVRIDNDVKLYVYGEAMVGAGRGYKHVLGITIGTGIASAIVNEGKLYYGHKAMAGELGHVHMEGIEEPCACGLRGCLESVASASGMVRMARKALEEGRPSVLRQWYPDGDIERLTGVDLSKAMDLGDELATEIIVQSGRLSGKALAAAALVLSPDIIVIGGGGALAGERLLAPLREELNRGLLPEFREEIAVVSAKHNEDAGIIGSALYVRSRIRADVIA